jgi:hypothetical protein
LRKEEVGVEDREACAHSGDAEVERALLELEHLSPTFLKHLASKGSNRAIRNLAKRRVDALKKAP